MPRSCSARWSREDRRHLNTRSDSEVLLNVFAHELQRVGTPRVTPAATSSRGCNARVPPLPRAATRWWRMIIGHGLLGFRDPHGIRPLVLGQREHRARASEYMLASESVALDMLSFELRARRARRARRSSSTSAARCTRSQCGRAAQHTPCIFEYVYFARPDSIIDNISVHKARMRMGEKLAEKIQRLRPDHDIDVVIPIPDTTRDAARCSSRRRSA